MLTPQRKGWSGWLSPRADTPAGGKAIDEPPPPTPPPPNASLGENGAGGAVGGKGDAGDWRGFREAGFLDKSRMQARDREALIERISDLEAELHEYQFNMGLLLIEKKEWSSRFEEMSQGLAAAEEFLKRDQVSHLNTASEFEKREQNLRKALGVEKQCVADLEKALHEIRAEMAEVKFTSEKKLTDAYALEANLEEKRLEIDGKLCSADAKLEEANRKSREISRKLEDVVDRERKVQRELLSLDTERKTHEKDLAKQKEYLLEWENKLQEGQRRLVDGQRFLNEREDRVSETERVLKKKEETLDEKHKLVEASKNLMKDNEDDISTRLRALTAKEKDVDVKMDILAKKERDLLANEENLIAREKVGIQKLLDDHKLALDSQKQEFQLEMERKREFFEEEMKNKLDVLEKEKIGIRNKEEQVAKREQTLESKIEKMKSKEKDLDAKSKALKKWENSIKVDEKSLKKEKKQLEVDMEKFLASKDELEMLNSAIETEKQQLISEKENLKLTEDEREQHLLLQSKLKLEIEEYRKLKESVIKEIEALRKERETFESEWEELDEKRVALEAEQKLVDDERCRFEKWRLSEDARLKNESAELRVNIQRELEDLLLKKEDFERTMEHERLEVREAIKRENADIARELELRKHELEMKMQRRQEDLEKKLHEREADFDNRREMELGRIKSLISLNESENRKLKMEQQRLEREKEQLSTYRKKIEVDQLEIQKDVNTLRTLSRNLKDQREGFIKERERFLSLAKQCKICNNCGVPISELELLGLDLSTEIENAGDAFLPSPSDGHLEELLGSKSTNVSPQATSSHAYNSGGSMSWLQKCSRLFSSSPGEKVGRSIDGQAEKSFSFGARLEKASSEGVAEPAMFYGVVNHSFDTDGIKVDSITREKQLPARLDKSGDEQEPSLGITDNSVDIIKDQFDNDIGEREDHPPENDSQPLSTKQRRQQPSKKAKPKAVKRTRTIKAVVKESQAFLGERAEMKDGETNDDAMDSMNFLEESQGGSVDANQVATGAGRKRRLPHVEMKTSELDAEGSEARSESISLGGRRKRRQTSATGQQTPGEKRYNLRRSTVVGTTAVAQISDQAKGVKAVKDQRSRRDEILNSDANGEGNSKHELTVASSEYAGENKKTTNKLHKTNIISVSEVQEMSYQKLVQFEAEEAHPESNGNVVIKSRELSEQSGEDGEEVDGTAADEVATPSPSGGESGSDDGEDGSYGNEEKHNASISKKLWTFFTT